jgi:CHAT domain-containing protein/predicted negative regulator of RcsB-dependent stress response
MRTMLLEAAILILCFGGTATAETSELESFVKELMAAPTEEAQRQLLTEKRNLVTAETMDALILEGDQLHYQEKYSETFAAYHLALEIAELIGDQASAARIMRLMGDTRRFQRKYGSAQELYQRSLDLSERLQNKELRAYALLGLANNQRDDGRYDDALKGFQTTLKLANEARAIDLIALGLNGIGSVHYQQGDYTEAIVSYQEAYKIYHELSDEIGACRILISLGIVHYQQGNYLKALEQYDKALRISERLEDGAYSKLILTNIALLYHMQGNYSQAWNIYRRTLKLLSNTHDPLGLGWLFHNMGHLCALEKRYSKAQVYYRKSLGYADELGNHELRILNLANLGDVYLALSNGQRAQKYYHEALAVQHRTGSKEPLSRLMVSLGNSYFAEAQFERALQYSNHAAELARQLGNLEVLWKAQTLAGRSEIKLGRLDEAKDSFMDAIATIERLRNQLGGNAQEQELFFESKLSPYQEIVGLLIQQRDFRQAFSYVERGRARVLLDALAHGKVNISRTMTQGEQEEERRLTRSIVSTNEQLSHSTSELQILELRSRLREARLDYDDFESRLYARHPELKVKRGEYSSVNFEDLGGVLPEKTTYLSYAVLEDKIYLFLLRRERRTDAEPRLTLKVYPIGITTRELSSRINKLKASLMGRTWDFGDSARVLYDLLLKPAERELCGQTTLCISPESILWDLPFQCLQPKEDHYLLDDYILFFVPSLSVLSEMTSLARSRIKSSQPSLLAFGNPSLGAPFSPLPESEREVKRLRLLYGASPSNIYTGSAATEVTAKSEMGEYDVLHFATHSVFDHQNPLYSFLRLSASADEDGFLEARELLQMNLRADIAVLSACETGKGKIGLGEGIIGLSWAFFLAGCPTTVVSQWKVNSASTANLMAEFHRNLLLRNPNPSKAAALRHAALKIRRSSLYEHPFYWAPFILIGGGI